MRSGFKAVMMVAMCWVALSCEDDDKPPYDFVSISKCSQDAKWKYDALRSKILGTWEWRYIKCCGYTNSPYQNLYESKGLRITFREDGTGTKVDGTLSDDFIWELKDQPGWFTFEISIDVSQLGGAVCVCNDIMTCNGSYLDGADNLFVRVK